jgi:sulfur-carrier protein adenylyltransferase/sulfurtransferase
MFACREESPMPLPEFTQLCNEAKKEIHEMTAADLRRLQQSGDDFTLIDVREREEQAKGTIPGAVCLPRGILEVKIDQVTADKDRKIVLYCAGGNRSALGAWMLKKMGFRNVISLIGGYNGWTQE